EWETDPFSPSLAYSFIKKLVLEVFMMFAGQVHQFFILGFVTKRFKQGIGHKVRITKETSLDTVPQHPQRRRFVTQHCVGLSHLVNSFGVAHFPVLNLLFEIAQDVCRLRISTRDVAAESLSYLCIQRRLEFISAVEIGCSAIASSKIVVGESTIKNDVRNAL